MNSFFVNVLPGTLRIAHCRDGRLQSLLWENQHAKPVTDAVYLGRVTQVLSGIQSAFVELGEDGTAFLNRAGLPPELKTTSKSKLSDVLKPGQPMWVQIQKTALEGKQCQVTARPRFLGFFLIFLPMESGIRFSKKFNGNRQDVASLAALAGPGGWIVRSSAAEVEPDLVAKEALALRNQASAVLDPPEGKCRLIWKPDTVRQFLSNAGLAPEDGIYVDDEPTFEALKAWLQARFPQRVATLQFHHGARPLFEVYKVRSQIEKAMAPSVWLPSGGSLEIRQTPALVAIDINSGKHTKARGGKSSALRTNLEALDEVAHQLRVRNLAGVIVVDFIAMSQQAEVKQLAEAAKRAFREDAVQIDQLPINRFGLLILTRERQGPDLNRLTHRRCPRCKGGGWVLRGACVAVKIQTSLMRDGEGYRGETIRIRSHPELAEYLAQHRDPLFSAIEKVYGFQVRVQGDPALDFETYQLELAGTGA